MEVFKMSKSIKLSPKHGVNPTIPVCFFCGEEKNEIALLGKIGDGRKKEDFEAPRHMVLDYEPCDKCKEQWSQGVALIEVVTESPDGRPPIQQDLYPTGRMCVVRPEAWSRITNTECEAGQRALLDKEVFDQLFSN